MLPRVLAIALSIGAFAWFDGGCGGSGFLPLPNGGIGGASEYVGADICLNCHREIHAAWYTSKHAKAINSLTATNQQFNGNCVGCHTTGYRAGGFVSMTETPKFAGVQCESCHGPGARHVATRKPADIQGTPLTSVCGKCHTGPAQPEFEEWSGSKHAQSLTDARNSTNATDACLACHSLDYAFAVNNNAARVANGLPPEPLPVINNTGGGGTLAHDSVGCSSCHTPHSSGQRAMLRADTISTCTPCHTDPQPTIGKIPHAPNWNILTGTGGQFLSNSPGVPTAPLAGAPSIHSTVESLGGCGKCHGLRARVDNPTTDMPNRTGHRFEIAYENCTPCHTPEQAQANATAGRAEVTARIASLRQAIAQARQSPSLLGPDIVRINAAELDLNLVEQDASGGSHNMPYVRQLLDAAQNLLDAIPP